MFYFDDFISAVFSDIFKVLDIRLCAQFEHYFEWSTSDLCDHWLSVYVFGYRIFGYIYELCLWVLSWMIIQYFGWESGCKWYFDHLLYVNNIFTFFFYGKKIYYKGEWDSFDTHERTMWWHKFKMECDVMLMCGCQII